MLLVFVALALASTVRPLPTGESQFLPPSNSSTVAQTVQPTTRRPLIVDLFMYPLCTTTSNASLGTLNCGSNPGDEKLGRTSFVLSTIGNTGANDAYTFNTNDPYVQSLMPPNMSPLGAISIQVQTGEVELAYSLSPVIQVPDRYVVQQGTQETCPPASLSCSGIATTAPPGQPCNTTQGYSNGGGFQDTSQAFPFLALIPTEVIYSSTDPTTWACGASLCGVCRDVIGLTQRVVCEMSRFLPVYPMWDVVLIDPSPVATVRATFTLVSSVAGVAPQVLEIDVNIDTSLAGNASGALIASAYNGAIIVEFLQMTSFFPFPGQDNYLVMAEQNPLSVNNPAGWRPQDAAYGAGTLQAMDSCPAQADVRQVYCPPANAWDEAQIMSGVGRGDTNPRPQRCQPYSKWWFYAKQGFNGWRHGYEKFQVGIQPGWPLYNNGLNAVQTCNYGIGYGVPGFDEGSTNFFSVTELPSFFVTQNAKERASVPTGLPPPNAWDCNPVASTNMPPSLTSNEGFANVWPDGTFLRAELAAPANAFLMFAFDIAGVFMELTVLPSQGYMYVPNGGCNLVENNDGSFVVGVVNTGSYAASYGITVSCGNNTRYVITSAEATITLPANGRGLIDPPINIRLQGGFVPTGAPCTASLFDEGTGALLGTLEQQCQEHQIERVPPLGASNNGIQSAPQCSFWNFACKFGISMPDLEALILEALFAYLLFYLVWLAVGFVGLTLFLKYGSPAGKAGAAAKASKSTRR
jgi:hypothetical protein